MPNLISHYYFAKTVKEDLPKKALEIVERHPDCYYLGAIGPDFLFAFRELGLKERLYPNTMQYLKIYEVFEKCRERMVKSYEEREMSYLLGLLCHYCSDFCLHPYVNYYVENTLAKFLPLNQIPSIHALIESAIDSHLCEEKMNVPAHAFKAHKTLKSKRSSRLRIGKLYYETITPIFGFEPKPRKLAMAFTITKLFMAVSVDKFKIKKAVFGKIEDILGAPKRLTGLIRPPEGYKEIDYMNFRKQPWLKVRNGDEYTTENVYQALERAHRHAIEYITDFMQKISSDKPLDKEKFLINYEGVNIG